MQAVQAALGGPAAEHGTEMPIVFDDQDLTARAERHLRPCDYKAAAVYTRSAFEKLIRKRCGKKGRKVAFRLRLNDYTTEDFWKLIKDDLPERARTDIESYRSLALNPFSRYNTERHEIKTELGSAIRAVKELRDELAKL